MQNSPHRHVQKSRWGDSNLCSCKCLHSPTFNIFANKPKSPEEDQAEIDKFDLKVYTASQKMSEFHSGELKRLGSPFFGVNPKLIIMNEIQQVAATRDPLSQATITEAELIALQRKMIQYLEDLYKD